MCRFYVEKQSNHVSHVQLLHEHFAALASGSEVVWGDRELGGTILGCVAYSLWSSSRPVLAKLLSAQREQSHGGENVCLWVICSSPLRSKTRCIAFRQFDPAEISWQWLGARNCKFEGMTAIDATPLSTRQGCERHTSIHATYGNLFDGL